MSLTNVVAKYKTGTYTVTRENFTIVDGLAVIGAPTVFTIDASVQPAEGAELVDNPEGKSVYTKFKLWTLAALQMETTTTSPDVITIGTTNYRVMASDHFGILSNHWKILVEKVDVP